MSHPVIVGVDTSERAHDAVRLGRQLAPALNAELVIAHVFPYDIARSRYASVGFERLMHDDAENGMQSLVELAGPDARMIAEPEVSPARGLHRLAEREHAELLVTASSHRGRLGRTFLGDIAQQTLHGSPCGVAVAPLGYGAESEVPIRKIGVGFDGETESKEALNFAAGLAQSLGADLHLLASSYVSPVVSTYGWVAYDVAPFQEAEQERLSDLVYNTCTEQPVACHGEVVARPAVGELLRLSQEVDLLVLGSRRFGPVRRLLLGTTSDEVVRQAACPVLVLPRGAHVPTAAELPVAYVPSLEPVAATNGAPA